MSTWTGARPTDGQQRGELERRVSELERLVGQLVNIISVTGGDVNIEAPGKVKIKGTSGVAIETANSVQVNGISMQIAAAGSMAIKASCSIAIKGATVSIDGAPLRLNGGGKPVARTGDLTMPNPSPGAPSIIGPGSPSVLA